MESDLGLFNAETINVSTTPVRLTGVSADRPAPPRRYLRLTPTADVFIGGPGVTTTTGFKVTAGASLELPAVDGVWGIAAAATTVSILEGF